MLKMAVFLLLFCVGAGAGIGAGLLTAPEPQRPEPADSDHSQEQLSTPVDAADVPTGFAKLSNQFVIPIVNDKGTEALVVLSLSLEVLAGETQAVHAREPKLRDALLRVLFDHANLGGFDGHYTRAENMDLLRRMLFDTARAVAGPVVQGVLILDIARQDV